MAEISRPSRVRTLPRTYPKKHHARQTFNTLITYARNGTIPFECSSTMHPGPFSHNNKWSDHGNEDVHDFGSAVSGLSTITNDMIR